MAENSRQHTSTPTLPRVLVIDDEPLMGQTIQLAFRGRCDVVVAQSGARALEILREDAGFDLILCDMMMPDLGGREVYERAVGSRADLAQRFVFMTGGAFTQDAHDFLNEADVPQLEKPFRMDQVERLLKSKA